MKLKFKLLSVLLGAVLGEVIVLSSAGLSGTVGTLAVVVIAAVACVVVHKLLQPLATLLQQVRAASEQENKFEELTVSSKDEIGQLAAALNELIGDSQADLAGVLDNTEVLQEHGSNSVHLLEQNANELDNQISNIDQIATAATQMSATAAEVAQHAELTASATQSSSNSCEEGQKVIEQNLEAISKLETQITVAGGVIESLEENSENISNILATIQGIAAQTNLLALNAAIEAARAGEFGRGFAVVADEVRNLAQRTQDATVEISNMIEVLQNNSHEAVEAMMESAVQAEDSVLYAQQAKTQLGNITTSINEISQMTEQIASAAEEQHAVAEDISTHTETVRDSSNTLAGNVRNRVEKFREFNQIIDDTTAIIQKMA